MDQKNIYNVGKDLNRFSFRDLEERCRRTFDEVLNESGSIFHMCTPGDLQFDVFLTRSDFEYGMNLVAMCAYEVSTVKVITFELMNNHVHFVMAGHYDDCIRFFELFKKRLKYYLSRKGKLVDLIHFKPQLIPIENLEAMRNQIAYTNRNGYLVHSSCTPFSYPYGANIMFFLPEFLPVQYVKFGDLSVREKRAMLYSHSVDYPSEYKVVAGFISPDCYCAVKLGEAMFRDASHYFYKVSKDIEAYKDVASMTGDRIFYSDDELNAFIFKFCKDTFPGKSVSLLTKNEKYALAKVLHYDFNADNAKISRLLKLSDAILNEWFPKSSK